MKKINQKYPIGNFEKTKENENNNINNNDETEGNVSSMFSEQMSRERNLNFGKSIYFEDNWDFPHKIIHRETKFNDN